nr:hypothetical protein [uncultured bacterium]
MIFMVWGVYVVCEGCVVCVVCVVCEGCLVCEGCVVCGSNPAIYKWPEFGLNCHFADPGRTNRAGVRPELLFCRFRPSKLSRCSAWIVVLLVQAVTTRPMFGLNCHFADPGRIN